MQHMAPFTVAAHVRRCDKGSEAYLHPLGSYLRALWDYDPGSAASIFLVTDDARLYSRLHAIHRPRSGEAAPESQDPAAPFTFVYGNRSARGLRTCEWCGAPGLNGNTACLRRHQERALLDLHISSHAPLAVISWSSNYGHLLLDLQLFRHSFCSLALPVDNYFHGHGSGWAYLHSQTWTGGPREQRVVHNVTVIKTRGAGADDRRRTKRPLPVHAIASLASTEPEQTNPWVHAVSAACSGRTEAGARINACRGMNCSIPAELLYI